MSEANLFAEVYFEDEANRQTLIDRLESSLDELQLEMDTLSFEVFIDEVISIEGMAGAYSDLEVEFCNWLKGFKPDVAVVYISNKKGSDSK